MHSSEFLIWMVVAGGFISYFLGDGCTYSAGILFTEFKEIFNASSAATSLLPAMIYAIPQFMSPFVCPITEIVGYSTAAAWGGVFLCISFIGNNKILYHPFLSHIICPGDRIDLLCLWLSYVAGPSAHLYICIYGSRRNVQKPPPVSSIMCVIFFSCSADSEQFRYLLGKCF